MTLSQPSFVQTDRAISSLTTLEIGGLARYFAEPQNIEQLKSVISWAKSQEIPIYPIGGGSNILASDDAFNGLIIRPKNNIISIVSEDNRVAIVKAGAGTVWDDLVAYTVEHQMAGLECLSGIPGRVGASPIQNIGAYGQEVSQTISSVEVLEIATENLTEIKAEDCAFSYRSSNFKTIWRGQYIITAVNYRLIKSGKPSIRYRDLKSYFNGSEHPTLKDVRQAVIDIRRSKSMLYDLEDPNHRSAGSFFLNPIVPQTLAENIKSKFPLMPLYPAPEGTCKLSAAWLISNSGFNKGFQQGRARLSDNHVLCLVNSGGATATEMLSLAQTLQNKVKETFGIELIAEPNLLGF